MPVLRPDTLVQNVLQILAVTGGISLEFSVSSGKSSHGAEKWCIACPEPAAFRHRHTGEEVRTKALCPQRKGP